MESGKTEVQGFYKIKEGYLVNTDQGALKEYKSKKMKDIKLNTIESDVSSMKNDIEEIKNLLRGLVK
jgi:hypothetical protein